ncbi:hypothetical protein [Flavobacterium sp. 102]|uniref:hypothetical protein n=1 Tax=Flavobacterium sp. 102 TaxID=2135623 RepID=UPI000EAD2ACF|nr:hypothetical protein [Flavobacterium sp. 102]RKS03581.1 hypothetical protein C8C84_3342 [Flavobacterium sp. 102]
MKNEILSLPPELRELAEMYFVMLKSENKTKKRDTLQLNLSGYADVMYLIADIVKVSILALEGETSCTRIPEPMVNISGVLGIILDLIPYEEADLLDKIREAVLLQEISSSIEEEFIIENIFLTTPTSFQITT